MRSKANLIKSFVSCYIEPFNISCQSLPLMRQMRRNLLGWIWLKCVACAVASEDEVLGIWSSGGINSCWNWKSLTVNKRIRGCAHVAQIVLLCVALRCFSLAAFYPSVSDTDVSHSGLQGTGWKKRSESGEVFAMCRHTHPLIAHSFSVWGQT